MPSLITLKHSPLPSAVSYLAEPEAETIFDTQLHTSERTSRWANSNMVDLHFSNFAPEWPPVDSQDSAPPDGMDLGPRVGVSAMDVDFEEYINSSPQLQQPNAISSPDRKLDQAPFQQGMVQQLHSDKNLSTPQHRTASASSNSRTPLTWRPDFTAEHALPVPNNEPFLPATPTTPGNSYPTANSKYPQTRTRAKAPPEAETPCKRAAEPQGRPRRTIPCTWEGCKRELTGQHNLKQHIREAHTGERPFSCEECAKNNKFNAFTRPATLNRHLRDIHGVDVGPGRGQTKRRNCGGKKKVTAGVAHDAGMQAPNAATDVDMGGFGDIRPAIPVPATVEPGEVDMSIFEDHDDPRASGFDLSALMPLHIPDNLDPALFTDPENPTLPEGQIQFNFPVLHHIPNGRFRCGSCGYTRDEHLEVIDHIHAHHSDQVKYGGMCQCFVCEVYHEDDGGPEVVHEYLLNMPRPEPKVLRVDGSNAETEHERLLNRPRTDLTNAALGNDEYMDRTGLDEMTFSRGVQQASFSG